MTDPMQTFSEISTALQSLESALSNEVARARAASARQVTASLNDAVRRLRQAESRDEWIRTLNEAASNFADRAAFFPVSSRGLMVDGTEVPFASAPAVANAVESKDTIVAAASASELSEPVMLAVGLAKRVMLAPVLVNDRAAGVLCAVAGDNADVAAIELLASLASASVVTAQPTTIESKPAELVRIGGVPEPAAKPQSRPSWDDLTKSEQSVHLKAQRFARTTIAEMVLNKADAVRRGRAASNLYAALREQIDEGRDAFRRQFIETCPSMVDYFHLELVHTLAKDDSNALGTEYPGPLP